MYKPVIAEFQDFSFSYESTKKPVLNQLNLSLCEGETVLLMGKSGSGKSTLGLCLNGLYPEAVEGETTGDIYFKNKNIAEFPPGKLNQQIGIVFQDPESQFCMITVEDELAFTLENLNVPTHEMHEKITHVLSKVGMDGYQKRKLHELSGGQKQKMALAAVLLLEPELLILDEATANLDPLSSLEFVELIRHLQKEIGMAVLIIDHKADDWLEMTDRLLVLGKEGSIIADGNPRTIFTERQQLLKKEGIFIPKEFTDSEVDFQAISTKSNERLLQIQNVSFHRKKQTILNQINLDIYRGEFIAIVGENGAGKSTLLEIISGLLKVQHGNVLLRDKPLSKWREKELRKRMGFVFQNPEHQFITDTVYDEITFGMKLNNDSQDSIQRKADLLLNQFHLETHKFSNPFSLSGGQKRRLSVATMLDDTPDLLLFDEPTFGQDAQSTAELMNMILDLKAKGTAIVFVTHDMDLATFADRVFVLHEGKIAFSGTPDELWHHEDLVRKARLRLPYHVRNSLSKGEVYDYVY